MADATVSRLGQINGSGDEFAMFLKQFGGEILTSFEANNIMRGKHFERNISNGRTAQFPVLGQTSDSSYHTPGTELTGGAIDHAERTISVDGLLLNDKFIAEIDELMNHYDVRSVYTDEMGKDLARKYDANVQRMIIQAARSAAAVNGRAGGSTITNADFTGANASSALVAGLFDAAQKMDEKELDEEGRMANFRPAQYYALAQNKDIMNRDWGGRGSYATAEVPVVADIAIFKSNRVPNADDSTNSALKTKYQDDYSNVAGMVYTNMAVGTVKLMDLAMEHEYQVGKQGHLFVAKYAVGHGVLRPDTAIEFTTA